MKKAISWWFHKPKDFWGHFPTELPELSVGTVGYRVCLFWQSSVSFFFLSHPRLEGGCWSILFWLAGHHIHHTHQQGADILIIITLYYHKKYVGMNPHPQKNLVFISYSDWQEPGVLGSDINKIWVAYRCFNFSYWITFCTSHFLSAKSPWHN